MSRVSNIVKNAKFGVFFSLLSIPAYFFSRKLFLEYLGDEFIGLNGTLLGFLGFLNLAELGIGSAIGFTLYEPIFKNNHKKINDIINLFGSIYKKIGYVVFICGVILSFFFPYIFESLNLPLYLVYILFYALLYSTLQNYFYNYNIILLQADQKNYIITSYFSLFNLLKIIIQIIVVYHYKSFIGYILIDVLISTLNCIFLRKAIKKNYPWLQYNTNKLSLLKEYPVIIKKIKQMSVHRLSSFILVGTDQLLIFIFISVSSVAFFGNYQLIINNFSKVINNFFSGVGAGVGNLVAENDKNKINKVFWEIMSLRFFIAGISFFILYSTVEQFISLWIGDKYLLDKNIFLFMLLNLFILQIRGTVDNFIQAYGLYDDTWAPITEGLLNLILSIILAKNFGMLGIMLGTFISMSIIVLMWKPYYLFKNGFNLNVMLYWKGFIYNTFVLSISVVIVFVFKNKFLDTNINSFFEFFIYAFKICLMSFTIYVIMMLIMVKHFRFVFERVKSLIVNFIK